MRVSRRSTLAGIAGSLVPIISHARLTHQRVGSVAPPSGPIPVSIAPPAFTVYDNAHNGDTVVTLTATMSDSSMFTGTWGFTTPYGNASGLVTFSGSSSNLVLTRDLSGADDGTHMITVTATESGTTIQQDLTMTVTTPPAATNFVTGVVAGSNNTTTWSVGIRITVGGSPLTVYSIGRRRLSGNSHVHDLWIFNNDGGGGSPATVVPGGHVTIDLSSGTLNAFKYANLPTPVVLQAGGTYFIQSQENGNSPTAAPDTTLSNDTTITTTGVASAISAAVSWTTPNYDNGWFLGGSNTAFGPVDFTYTVGFPAGYIGQASGGAGAVVPNGNVANTQAVFPFSTNGVIFSGTGQVVSGTITLNGASINGFPGGNITLQWFYDNDQPLSGQITSNTSAGGPYFAYTFDTHSLADGTHIIYAKLIDADSVNLYQFRSQAAILVVSNSSISQSTQSIYVAGLSRGKLCQPVPNQLTYTGGNPNPTNTTYAFPYAFSAPAAARGLNPTQLAALRNQTNIVYEAWNSPQQNAEYVGYPQFVTTTAPGNGVYVQYLDPLLDHSTLELTTDPSWIYNGTDGTRLNAQISAASTFVEAPSWLAGGFAWLFVSAEGRLGVLQTNGTVTTICGFHRDKTKLTIDPGYAGISADSDMPNYQTFVGTSTDGSDLYGAVDLAVDPNNDHIVYICCQLTNCIIKVVLTGTSLAGGVTASFAVWAGLLNDAIAGSLVDSSVALNARFFQPGSIVISDGTGNSGPIGTMYVADTQNNAIRKISPSGTNAVTTLYGGNGSIGPGPTPVDISVASSFTTVNLSGTMTWSTAGGGTLSITTASPTLVQGVGFFIGITGSVNGGSGGSVNLSSVPTGEPFWTVNGFTSSSQFTVAMPGTTGQYGPFTGTIQILSYYGDYYSRPGTVTLIGTPGWVIQPAVLRFCSSGNLVLAEFYSGCAREIDLVANTARRIGIFDGKIAAQQIEQSPPALTPQGGVWMWMDCDSKGVLGPVDDIVLSSFQSANSAAHYDWRLSFDGTYSQQGPNDGGQVYAVGQNDTLVGGAGHYPWAWAFARSEGRAIGSGNSLYPPPCLRIQESSDYVVTLPNGPNFNETRWTRGRTVFEGGTGRLFPWTLRPSFANLWSFNGNGHIIGFSFDDLMHHNTSLGNFTSTTPGDAGDVALAAFIRAGMPVPGATTVPRPEIPDNDIMDMIYYIRRNTMQGSGYSSSTYTNVPPVQPQVYSSDVTPPIISNVSAMRISSTSISVTWTTDKATCGCASAGSAAQNAISGSYPTYWKTPVFSPIETAFASGVHTVTIAGLPTGATVYYNVVVTDQAGNYQFSATQGPVT